MFRILKNRKGVTLVELLAVIVILGIIAAIAVPTIGNLIERRREDAAEVEWLAIEEAAGNYAIELDEGDVFSVQDLFTEGYLSESITVLGGGTEPTTEDVSAEDIFVVGDSLDYTIDLSG
ncbi:MAG: prepilin-type N-terminal cleavage/methylation domain-containing protein, partial [Bacilli bacterium]|nr:prepilin-type N-terminal cleavage/methylation domain-containing protein [Bacilli bacterium]